jgi:chorismate mutase
MPIRGIRGAIQTTNNTSQDIHQATRQLLEAICEANHGLEVESVASIFFTVTPDLDAAFPALAARQLGWINTPLLCAQEIPVPNS